MVLLLLFLQDYVLNRGNRKRVNLDLLINQDDLKVLQLFSETGEADLAVVNEALTNIFSVSHITYEDDKFYFRKENKVKDEGISETEINLEDNYFNILKPFCIFLFRLPLDWPQVNVLCNYFSFFK